MRRSRPGRTGDGPAPTAGDVVRLEVAGDVDLTTSAQLRDRLEGAGRSSVRAVVVDLSGVDFIDCHGLGVLLTAQTELGARLLLEAPAPVVTRLLELTGTQHRFDPPPAGTGTSSDVDDGPGPTVATSTNDAPPPHGAATASAPWSPDVLSAVSGSVEHLQRCCPADLWVATRIEGEHQVVTAAAGPWASELPAGTTLPWRRPLGATDDLDGSAWPVTDADELLGQGTGTGRRLAVAASTGALLLAGDEVVGTVCGFTSRATTAEPLAAAAPVVHLLGQLLSFGLSAGRERAVASDPAQVDALTGLRDRRGWQERLAREDGGPSTRAGVVAIALDGLRTTNDTYGHPAGDALLVATAEVLRRTCRPGDVLARPGGDEFTVLAFEADPAALTALSARVGHHLHAVGIPASVVAVPQELPLTLEDTWARADRELHAVKALRRARATQPAPPGGEDAVATDVLGFYEREGLLPASSTRSGEEERETGSTASRLDFIHRARGAGLSPDQVRGALALRHSGHAPAPAPAGPAREASPTPGASA